MKFDVSSAAEVYPEMLREVRHRLKMSQYEFAEAAGYSNVMQGRYEAKRGTSNSAIPSAKTAMAIKAMVEARLADSKQVASQSAVPAQSLKAFGPLQIKKAIEGALHTLTGMPYEVKVKKQVWEGPGEEDAEIQLTVSLP